MSDIRQIAEKYIAEGWSPIPIPSGEKGPRESGWETRAFDAGDFHDGANIGVHLGINPRQPKDQKDRLYDVDLDDRAAAIAADLLLPNTGRVSGRPGKPRSHRFFVCDEPITHIAYHGLGGNNDTIVELRGISKNGSPTQTVVPPSRHPSGELIEWASDQKPMHLPGDELQRGVRNVAIATLLGRSFPGPGNRHEPRLALAGFLGRVECLVESEVQDIGRAVMTICGGKED